MLRFLGIVLLSVSLLHSSAFAGGAVAQQVSSKAHAVGRYVVSLGAIALLACTSMSCDRTGAGKVADMMQDDGMDVTDTAILIGLNYDGRFDINALTGAQLAIDEINDAGGINGLQLELIPRQNMKDVATSIQLTHDFIEVDKVHTLIGPEYSSHALAVGPIAQANQIPMVTTTATNPNVTAAGDYVFMAAFTDSFQGKIMANFAYDNLQARTAAVITEEGDAYSEGLSQTFIDNFENLGGAVVVQQFYPADATDFSIQLAAVQDKNPDAIFVPGFVPEVGYVVKQGKEMGIMSNFIGADGWGNADLVKFGGVALEDTYYSNHFYTKPEIGLSQRTIAFIQNHVEVWGERPISRSALGYDAVYLIAQAIDRADSLEGAAISDQLAATQNYNGATFISGFTENRHAIKSAVIETVRDGGSAFHALVRPRQ